MPQSVGVRSSIPFCVLPFPLAFVLLVFFIYFLLVVCFVRSSFLPSIQLNHHQTSNYRSFLSLFPSFLFITISFCFFTSRLLCLFVEFKIINIANIYNLLKRFPHYNNTCGVLGFW